MSINNINKTGFSSDKKWGAGFKKDNSVLGFNLPHIDWNKQELSFFEKNLYNVSLSFYRIYNSFQEHPSVKCRNSAEIDDYRRRREILVKSSWAPNPITTFEEAQLPPYTMEAIRLSNFREPTPIQSQGFSTINKLFTL